MKIFHNQTTNQVIIECDGHALSFYNYSQDGPIDAALEFLIDPLGLATFASVCKEIEIPTTPLFDKDPDETNIKPFNPPDINKTMENEKPCEH